MAFSRSLRAILQTVIVATIFYISVQGVARLRAENLASTTCEDAGQPSQGLRRENITLGAQTPPYLEAVLNPVGNELVGLDCSLSNGERYEHLVGPVKTTTRPRYFFALDLHQNLHVLPRLLGSILETIRFLGPASCVLSVVEGRSTDGTYEVLDQLHTHISKLGSRYIFRTSAINPAEQGRDRVQRLALLRNLAINDLLEHPDAYDPATTIIFLNDISVCAEDILELVHQKVVQGAHQTCAMDWTYVGEHPTFYDIWVARGMSGDLFFQVPEDGNWNSAWNLFWNDPVAQARLQKLTPFQVFACWNGVAAITAKPFMEGKIKFRANYDGECYAGEPLLLGKDLWANGYGKIAVVPSVNVEYSDTNARRIKALKGYTADHTKNERGHPRIEWEAAPPERLKCARSWDMQSFVPWNQGMPQSQV
ncbi:glycosyltransferase family 69 protein [Lophiostoma macrostomum CBS 122681]|uniref:Glycosyltransferase family 69 protein n=1 Tax=Lophiostoma macrostomum CBS 122681 TaxID=1314788 RepID=A0A6A6T6U2_9PLEO|nr:glycosyltransferase family 69 protein [Lophiostoma macrostomum CBS 122681]